MIVVCLIFSSAPGNVSSLRTEGLQRGSTCPRWVQEISSQPLRPSMVFGILRRQRLGKAYFSYFFVLAENKGKSWLPEDPAFEMCPVAPNHPRNTLEICEPLTGEPNLLSRFAIRSPPIGNKSTNNPHPYFSQLLWDWMKKLWPSWAHITNSASLVWRGANLWLQAQRK